MNSLNFRITDQEVCNYQSYLSEIKSVEQCLRKERYDRISFVNDHFGKSQITEQTYDNFDNWYKNLPEDALKTLKERISYISNIHEKFKIGESTLGDCSPVAIHLFKAAFKTISNWNEIFKEGDFHISLPENNLLNPSFNRYKTLEEVLDERALTEYFDILKQYPHLERQGNLNDHTQGVYEIIYDKEIIAQVRKQEYQKLYNRLIESNFEPAKAYELAMSWTRPGVVYQDSYTIVLKDVVKNPSNLLHLYHRYISKGNLDRNLPGVAALPIVREKGVNKISVQVVFRHPTGTWEIEMVRGGSGPKETPEQTAKREVEEETKYEIDELKELGYINLNSGMLSSAVPIYLGTVVGEKEEVEEDKYEAIRGKFLISFEKLTEAFKDGKMKVKVNEQEIEAFVRDPFLAYALFMAEHNNYLS